MNAVSLLNHLILFKINVDFTHSNSLKTESSAECEEEAHLRAVYFYSGIKGGKKQELISLI